MGRNVDVSHSDLPDRIRRFREEKRLTQADLAERAGLSYRTILDLEKGRRERVQVKTLMLLSEVLEVPYEELIRSADAVPAPTPAPRRFRRRTWALAAVLVAAIAALLVFRAGLAPDRYELDRAGHRLVARDDWLGIPCWTRSYEARISFCAPSPRRDDVVLLGLHGDEIGGGDLIALDRKTGDELWRLGPDVEAIARAFGEEVAYAAGYTCTGVASPDLDGDGVPELVARFCHALWYPNALCFVGPTGELVCQYSHKGHLYDMLPVDLDGDGAQELVVAGTNNTQAYQGATVFALDARCRSGASVDAEAAPESAEPDSARVRVVLPMFPEPYPHWVDTQRLEAGNIRSFETAGGQVRVSVDVQGREGVMLPVTFDADLRPLSCDIADAFLGLMAREGWPDSLTVGTGPADPAWRAAWLDDHLRFTAGHWPPDLPSAP